MSPVPVGLGDSGVDSTALSDCSVDSSALQDSAVSSDGIQDSAVDSGKLADSAVSSLGIQDGAIVAADLADSAVDSGKLADSAVSSLGIQDGSIVAADLADSAVDSGKLADSAVSSAGIQDGTIVAADFFDTNQPTRITQLVITDTTLATGDSQFHFFIPPELDSWDLVDADAANATPSTTGNPTIQIRNVTDAADMLSTKITIDTAEKTSYTAATPPVIDTANDSVVTGNEIAVDIDSAGANPEGLNVILQWRKY